MWDVLRGTCALLRRWGGDWGCWCPQGPTSPPGEEVQGTKWTGWAVRRVRHVTSPAFIAAAAEGAVSLSLLLAL